MSKFALIEIEAVRGKQKFYKLVKDGVCEFDVFEADLEVIYGSQMKQIYVYMDLVSNLKTLPKHHFKDITPKKELVKEYEFKTEDLRVYAIHEAGTGKIIITGGFKSTQKSDINHFHQVKKQYLQLEVTNDKRRTFKK